MDVITPRTLTDALRDFKERGDARWIDESELEDKAKDIVDDYLAESSGLTDEDIADILGE